MESPAGGAVPPTSSVEGLDEYLHDLEVDADLVVDRTLKRSPKELTEVVHLRGRGGSMTGPYVRKTFAGERAQRALGQGYLLLYQAQREGRRFAHLPRILLCSDQADRLVVVMEYVRGRTLGGWIEGADEGQRLAVAQRAIPQLCEALAELHEGMDEPVVHRDVKPSNVICTGEGDLPESVVLVDLGISRAFRPGASSDTERLGTEGFAAPEQFGFAQTDVRTDVFAAGMTLAYCLLGRVPTAGDRERGLAGACGNQRLCAVARRATAFDPEARYQTAEALRRAVVSAFADAGDGARRAGAPAPQPALPLGMPAGRDAAQPALGPAPHRAGLLARAARLLGRGRADRVAERLDEGEEVDFCPNCGAILNAQQGFAANDGYWVCRACGQQLFGDGVYAGNRYPGVMWYCDQCGDLLNRQPGFDDIRDAWRCTSCGYVNRIARSEIDG